MAEPGRVAVSLHSRARGLVLAAWLPVLALGIIGVFTTIRPSPFFPPLSRVGEQFVLEWFGPGLVEHVVPSLMNFALGFLCALIVGVVVGVALAKLPLLELLVDPLLQFLRGVPGVVLLPLVIILMGTTDVSKIVLIAFGSVWPILLNTVDGVKSIPPETLQTTRSYRITRWNVLVRVLLPGAFPQISVGIRLSLSIALVLVVASEFYGATRGVGFFILEAKQTFNTSAMWAGVVLLGIIGYLLSIGYTALENRMLRWRAPARP